jgi:inner membrane protein involved in colicin E2 resistance
MNEILKIIIGICVLVLGIPIGYFLAKFTKEELKQGKFWFQLIIIFSLIWAILSLIFKNDAILFGLLFIAIVTSMSLKNSVRKIYK